jgi:hypothetical protein
MASCCCLSMEEIHIVAYLTMKGWEMLGNDQWYKEGFECSYKVSRGCGCHEDTRTRSDFQLMEAYDAQKAQEEKDNVRGA